MVKLKVHQVKAATLVEVIVAMLIILIVFTLAMGIYNNVLRATHSVTAEQVSASSQMIISQTINDRNWSDQEEVQDSIVFKKTVSIYQQHADLVQITVTAYLHHKQIGEFKKIVKKQRDED